MNELIKTVTMGDTQYPPLLRTIPDPPEVLYYIGDLSIASRRAVAIVGSRHASEYGKWASYNAAKRLSESGVVVVSGMAEGCDSFAHQGALEGNTPTIAVLGCGPDICYPRSAARLREKILYGGLLLSEYPPGTRPALFTFPARNRIISGLSAATIVAEAGISSGSLITAERAAEQGREVYAIPGNINRKNSVGANKLIRDGAKPLVLLSDILEDMGISWTADETDKAELSEDERRVFKVVRENGELSIEDVAILTKMPISTVTAIVTILEMKGRISFYSGKIIIIH
ncbi:MAG: DNA-processing protein DprA [Clostridiales Family XIII bacterium]|jgi:DNA processing protein|nr:DNA-processing protein DprA [Clostridiales Family XIII bacterium]